MRDELISMFIDDELDLDEKVDFVRQVRADEAFTDRVIEFLSLEKDLRSEVVERVPDVHVPPAGKTALRVIRPVHLVAASLAAAAALFIFLFWPVRPGVPGEPHRFVIYRPDVSRAEIVGSFTGWDRVPMQRAGSSGYWEISLDIGPGEHRYVFLLDGAARVPDPTAVMREKDDFGGENSVLVAGTRA